VAIAAIRSEEAKSFSVVVLVLAGTVLAPHASVGGLVLGADDLAALVLLPLLSIGALRRTEQPLAPATAVVAFLWFAILAHGVLMGFAASLQYFDRISAPTEMWQYLKRLAFFYAAFAITASQTQKVASAYRALAAILILATLIGLIQVGSGAFSEALSSLYARTDAQLERLVDRAIATRRVYGVAGHPVAWGGFCIFALAMALPWVLVPGGQRHSGRKQWSIAVLALAAFSIVNLLFSASRAALAGFVAVFLLKGFLELSLRRGGASAFGKWLFGIVLMTGAALYFALDRIALLAFRFLTLAEQGGGGRVDQVSSALMLVDSGTTLLTGVSNVVQRLHSVSHGVEVEPVYMLVNYGLIGTLLRYSLLLAIGIIALKAIRNRDEWHSAAGMAAFMSLAGYAVFSLGYFFFQELYVGVAPWLLFGMVAGMHQRMWSERRSPKKTSIRPVRNLTCSLDLDQLRELYLDTPQARR
jgi:hypothetical protein